MTYANVEDLISKRLKINDYLRDKELDIMYMVETKLSEDINVQMGDGKYRLWRRDRKDK